MADAEANAAVIAFTTTAATTLAAVRMKISPLMPTDPKLNGLIRLCHHSPLSPEFAMEVRDHFLKLPTENPYDVLKAKLIKLATASEQRKLQQLISGKELGNRKPTQLLRRLQQLLRNKLGKTG
ncbi:uncharacterized protein LOC134188548 [Corticium candelabrum]|uniref:uncharacterized protein LOC134188548 n=1 Tax=Corticium candelabrum TaxID=121492 RepID=UPI002E26B5DC|nr:uncharacterized protein LOC134188548 [Corticium candelabrum]